ncbi:MAG: TetR/AcrR family transcriptional regulator [Pseudomonadota bacterium]
MELLSTRDEKKREPQLNRDDWIVEALHVLLNEGVEHVQITRLARELNVTRGSFYWHFAGRDDLLKALLAEWRARNTGVMIEVLEHAPSLEAGILDLFSVWVDHSKFDPLLDQAVRDWARRDADIQKTVAQEDDDRVEAIASFLRGQDYEPIDAFIRARVIYFTQLSYYALSVSEPMETRMEYLSAYYTCFTGRTIDNAAAQVFKARLAAKEAAQ